MGRVVGPATTDPSVHSSGVDYTLEPNISAEPYEHQQQQSRPRRQASIDASQTVPPEDVTDSPSTEAPPFKPTRGFWFVMMSISATSLCGAVEGTIVANALPTITAALGGGNLYLWVPNAFFLASIAALPLYAQLADIFGRRVMLLSAISLYTFGCALGGASKSMNMLIAARAIQGLGSGGTDTLCETIVLDLVPLRERGKYMSYVSIGTVVGFAAGPSLGGAIVVKLGWPWIFYLNAILGGIATIMFFFFLRVKHQHGQSWQSKLKRIDFGGNAILISAVIAVLLAMTWAGPVYHWNSAKIIVPLVLGLLGLLAFTAFEWTPRLAPEPSFPRAIVSNRTSSSVLAMTLVNSITTFGTAYFLPIYFQGVLAKSPLASGTALIPFCALIIPFAIVSGILMSKVGKYRPIHVFGWSFALLTTGLCSTLSRRSSTATWAVFEIIGAASAGVLAMSLLPALQAPLAERYAATSAGTYCFVRGFGSIWGVTIPSAVFNNVVKREVMSERLTLTTNSTLAVRLANGQAYQLATKAFLDSLPPSESMTREQVIGIFERAVHVVFYVLTGFAAVGLLLVLLEKEIPMRTELKTEFGLDEGNNETRADDGGEDVGEQVAATAAAERSQHTDGRGTKLRNVEVIELEDMAGPSR